MNAEKLAAFVAESKRMAESELRRLQVSEEDRQAELLQIRGRISQLQRVIADCDEALCDEALADDATATRSRTRKAD